MRHFALYVHTLFVYIVMFDTCHTLYYTPLNKYREFNCAKKQCKALIISNERYRVGERLHLSTAHSKIINGTLNDMAFNTDIVHNAKESVLRDKLKLFSKNMRKDGVYVVYFVGHAVQLFGRIYVLPVDFTDRNLPPFKLGRKGARIDLLWKQPHKDLTIIVDAHERHPFDYIRAYTSEVELDLPRVMLPKNVEVFVCKSRLCAGVLCESLWPRNTRVSPCLKASGHGDDDLKNAQHDADFELAARLFFGDDVGQSRNLLKCVELLVNMTTATTTTTTNTTDDKEVLYILGKMYDAGYGLDDIDEAKSVSLLMRAADLGHVKAMGALGVMFQEGHGVIADRASARSYFRQGALGGDALSMYNLGLMLYAQRTTPLERNDTASEGEDSDEEDDDASQKAEEVVYWYKRAVELGVAQAQFKMAQLHLLGREAEQNASLAAILFKRAADQGHIEAQHSLAYLYAIGEGIPPNGRKAAYWFKKAAKQGNADSAFCLGNLYHHGVVARKNTTKSFMWYKRAVELGHTQALVALGLAHALGHGIEKDMNQALNYLKEAANQGNIDAQGALGKIFYDGKRLAANYELAEKYWRMAAKQGDPSAQYYLGMMYKHGHHVAQNLETAFSWFKRAAVQGEVRAQYTLGLLYANGQGVTRDLVQSSNWYRIAASAGDFNAWKALRRTNS